MNQFNETLKNQRNSLAVAELFVLKYGSKLPEELATLTICETQPRLQIHIGWSHISEEKRNEALTILGDVFGRSDWEGEDNYSDRRNIDWKKEVDGVLITIYGAQRIDAPKQFPVDPRMFPIQIQDAEEPS